MKVYNVRGQEIETLVNKYQESNNYSVQFNGSHLANGIYYYQLQLNNRIAKTKKMILLK